MSQIPDASPVASSATDSTIPVSTSDTLGALSESDRASWRLTGELPGTSSSSLSGDSTPAAPAAPVASTDASLEAASEPAAPQRQKSNADTRKAELKREIDELLRQRHEAQEALAAARRPASPDAMPAASSAAAPVTIDTFLARPDISQPPLTETQFFERFPDAPYGQFARYTARYEVASATSEQRAQAREQTSVETFKQRWQRATAADAEFESKLHPEVIGLRRSAFESGPITGLNVLADEIFSSDQAAQLMLHFSAHPEQLAHVRAMDALAVAREVGRLEARLSGDSKPVAAVPPKSVSSAPPPPQTLGSRPSMPSDAAQEALRAGDFSRYRAELNRREVTA